MGDRNKLCVYTQVADIHMTSISQGFLSSLGRRFLTLLYRAIDECESGILLRRTELRSGKEEILGFVSGSNGMSSIFKKLIRNFPELVVSLFPSILKWRTIKGIFELLIYNRIRKNGSKLPDFELLSIAVLDECKGKGYARELFTEFVAYCKSEDIDAFKIIVGKELIRARRFYENMGAVVTDTITLHDKQESLVYIYRVT